MDAGDINTLELKQTGSEFLEAFASSWEARTRAVERAHFMRCRRFRVYHLYLGAVAIISSSLLSVLTTVDHRVLQNIFGEHTSEVLLATLAIVSPVITSLVSFLRFDEKSTLHHNAAAKFAGLKRRLQLLWNTCAGDCNRQDVQNELNAICKEWDTLSLEAPALYKKEWSDIDKFERENKEKIRIQQSRKSC